MRSAASSSATGTRSAQRTTSQIAIGTRKIETVRRLTTATAIARAPTKRREAVEGHAQRGQRPHLAARRRSPPSPVRSRPGPARTRRARARSRPRGPAPPEPTALAARRDADPRRVQDRGLEQATTIETGIVTSPIPTKSSGREAYMRQVAVSVWPQLRRRAMCSGADGVHVVRVST